MRSIKSFFLFLPILFVAISSFAQMTDDPTTWKYEVKKKSATEYQLIFHLELKKDWHIWSMHPGGDGYEIAPSFTFDQHPGIKFKDSVIEKGKSVTTTMAGIDGKITYFTGKVDYIQNIIVKGNGKVAGKLEYQVCDNKMCLAPKDKDFTFEIK